MYHTSIWKMPETTKIWKIHTYINGEWNIGILEELCLLVAACCTCIVCYTRS